MSFAEPAHIDDWTAEASLNFTLTPLNSNEKIERATKIKRQPLRLQSQQHRSLIRESGKQPRPKSMLNSKPIIRRRSLRLKTVDNYPNSYPLPRLTKKTYSTLWEAFYKSTVSKQKLEDLFMSTFKYKLENMQVYIRFRYPNKKSYNPKKKLHNLNVSIARLVA